MLALDLDGTLLADDGTIGARTRHALDQVRQTGIKVVLCTGRRYRRALPIARELGLDSPLVCNSGAIIKRPGDHSTLWRGDFPPQLAAQIHRLFLAHNHPMVVYTDLDPHSPDFAVPQFPTGRDLFDEYVSLNHEHALVDSGLAGRLDQMFHVCAIGTRAEMAAFEQMLHQQLGGLVTTYVQRSHRYLGTMCELVRSDAGKWRALERLARLWGVASESICAVGDDMNDLAMIAGAGLGVAMAHAPEEVRAVADHVADTGEEPLARFLEDRLLS